MSFKEVSGQDEAISLIKSSIDCRRISGGYLFCGPEGVGKKITALNLAKALNCLNLSSGACEECASCLKINKLSHPDVNLIQNESEDIKIESIREMQRMASFRPYEGKFKVFIIDNAHRLTLEAANAILKVLEEPPAQSLIILITDRPGLLLRTIVSRCKSIKFSALARNSLKDILGLKYNLNSDLAHFLAYFCEGRIGGALRLKDTDIFREKNAVIDKFIFSKNNNIMSGALDKDHIRMWLVILGSWLRDMYFLKSGMPEFELIHSDRKADLIRSANNSSFAELNESSEFISNCALYLEQNVNIRLLLNNLESQLCKV
jgi:DNA polymerase III subunit delta'